VGVPAVSALSLVGRLVQDRLTSDVFDPETSVSVVIDTPAAVAKRQSESTPSSVLNLFFYRVEPSGFYADAGAHDRWFVRVRCLMTAFGQATTDSGSTIIPEGEIDLRVLGEVLRYFNENPIIVPRSAAEDVGANLQVVFSTLTSQEINQIWATQGDVAYRPSLLYEIALLPIEPKTRAAPSLPVVAGGLNLVSRGNMQAAQPSPPTPPPPTKVWIAPHMETGRGPDWVPVISFVTNGKATQRLAIAPGTTSANAGVWIAGEVGADVKLVWQHINRGTWEDVAGAGGSADATVPVQPAPLDSRVIDPADAAHANLVTIAIPLSASLPLLLHAERKTPGAPRSNPLIVSAQSGGGP
jgi:uncharacterized protein DUF4255